MLVFIFIIIIYTYLEGFFFNESIMFQDACANGYIATLSKDSEYKMSMIHAAYGTVIYSPRPRQTDIIHNSFKVLER